MSRTEDEAPTLTLTAARPSKLERRAIRLQVASGPDAGLSAEIEDRVRVGTRALAELVLHDPKVSGLHCEISAQGGLRVRDLGSKNGTYVGKVRVIEALIQPGDQLRLGDTTVAVLDAERSVEIPLYPDDQFYGIVGCSAAARALTARLARLAGTDTTVLIQGETGSGKERVVQALHDAGSRAAGPLVVVDCGSLTPSLIEDALFGHEQGAYTGAVTATAGAFEQAAGGTLFLDEIGELPLDLQPKLLRVLEARVVRRLGGDRPLPVDVRVVAATNRDLALEVTRGRFREDLYYRLAVVTVIVPPLRERPDDIPLLAAAIVREMGADPSTVLSPSAIAALASHDWPGNVRELRNTLERAFALMEPVELSLPERADASSPEPAMQVDLGVPMRIGKQRLIERYERAYLEALLAACDQNISEVARRAGMDRMSIYRALARLGLDRPRSLE